MLAVIGGSGFYNWSLLENAREEIVHTEYGDAKIYIGVHNNKEFAFLPRHGVHHSTPPHLINYRANIAALKSIGVDKIVALNAVGSLTMDYYPGDLVLMNDFLEFTNGRECTYFTGGHAGVKHIEVSNAYCKDLQKEILEMSHLAGVSLTTNGVLVVTNGPRFETPAEVKMFANFGGTAVGMTGYPEVVLANELGICYSAIGIITNYACGLAEPLREGEVIEIMNDSFAKIETLLNAIAENYTTERHCVCSEGGVFI